MKQKLPSMLAQRSSARKTLSVCLLLLMLCGVVYAQPRMIAEIPNASKNFTNINGNLYFSAGDNLYKGNPTSAPVLVKTTGQEILKIYEFIIGPNFFFVTRNSSGQTLWRSDGSAANTVQVATYPQIIPLLTYQSNLFLKIYDTATGVELWKMDAAYNVSMVKDIYPGSASGYYGLEGSLVEFNNLLYFFATTDAGQDLWRTDGSSAGTVMAIDLDDENYYDYSGFYGLTKVNDVMYFTRNYEGGEFGEKYADLFKTNGTPGGTSLVTQFTGGYTYHYLSNFLAFNGKLYFFHNIGDPIYSYFSVSDGTAAGTKHIDLTTIDGIPRKLIEAGNYMLFYAESQGNTTPIEKSDGTTVTTVHQFSYYHTTQDQYIQLTYAGNNRAFFLDDLTEYYGGSTEVWQADLSTGVTSSLSERYGVSFSGSGNIVADNGSIYFTRGISGKHTLWYYNPDAPPASPECESAGFIEREKWSNVTGSGVSSVPVNTQPNSIQVLSNFASTRNEGDNYGARVRGYICPPETGNYVFYISSDDNSELWLSTDDNAENKRLIASSKWTNYNEWTKYATQQSVEIPLVKGTKYYIEALHKEASGADHLSVGWKLPNGTLERPISGTRLSPFERNQPPIVIITQPADGATFTAPATIDISAFPRDTDGTIVKVAFYSSGTFLGEATAHPWTYRWQNVPAGTYTIEARATDNGGYVSSDFQTVTVSPGCTSTGTILRELWLNAPGTDVRTFDFSTPPTGSLTFNSFETSQYYANNYASRMRAHLCVPQTGTYTFWISSDDYSELYLSTDETEANKKLIAWVYGATPFRNYDKYSSQKSVQVNLVAGNKYYIEARHKEGSGNDFISVGWQLPDGTMERPIPGNRLIQIPEYVSDHPTLTIVSPQQGQKFSSPASIRIAAEANDPDGLRVEFEVSDGSGSRILARFTEPPYEYWWENVPPGTYRFTVFAVDPKGNGTGRSVTVTVENDSPCAGTGTLVREIWTGITGTSVSSIPVNSAPDRTATLTSFSTPNYYGNDYGSRIRGYVCAPATGAYTFWISGDDNSELWLSTNDDPANKTRIASVTGATSVNQWDKYSSQMSGTINLLQGHRYYIEVLHKEANGADHVEVGWRLPSGTLERPIPGNRVIPFEDASTSAASFMTEEVLSTEGSATISVYPNPVVSGKALTINLPEGTAGDLQVDVISATGVALQTEQRTSNGEAITLELKSSIIPGMYLIKVLNNRKRWTTKIHVK